MQYRTIFRLVDRFTFKHRGDGRLQIRFFSQRKQVLHRFRIH
ncbi:Uncharacterised protein [Vibrio cholerae]|nr:Uncharacterised protein [Vibrio cholerae]